MKQELKNLFESITVLIVMVGGFIGLFMLILGFSVAFWFYFVNFILLAFNTGIAITWVQALAISLVIMVISKIFRKTNGGK